MLTSKGVREIDDQANGESPTSLFVLELSAYKGSYIGTKPGRRASVGADFPGD